MQNSVVRELWNNSQNHVNDNMRGKYFHEAPGLL